MVSNSFDINVIELGMTQDDVVRRSGVKHTNLTRIEGDLEQKPIVQVIAKIAKA